MDNTSDFWHATYDGIGVEISKNGKAELCIDHDDVLNVAILLIRAYRDSQLDIEQSLSIKFNI